MNFFRVIKTSAKNFFRNLWLSLATFGMMVLALCLIGALILLNAAANILVEDFKNKADVSVYFTEEASEEYVLDTKILIEERDDVRSVVHLSRSDVFEEALIEGDAIEKEALELIGVNPYGAILRIKALDINEFTEIEAFIKGLPQAETFINRVGSEDNTKVIAEINSIATTANRTAIVFTIALIIFAFLVTYNTIRISIYTSRDEIHIMKLVGASNWFVRGPFIVLGFFYGVFSALITMAVMLVVTHQTIERTLNVKNELDLYGYLIENMIYILPALLLIGLFMGVVSSYIAVRRYLRV